jgi:hypothetical protein
MLGRNAMITKVVTEIGTGRILERRLRWTELPFAKLMGVRFPSVQSNVFIGPAPASAAEFAVVTTPPFSPPVDNGIVYLHWFMKFLTGATTTALVVQLRRGSGVAGTVVNLSSAAFSIGAAANGILSASYFDSPGVVAGLQYTLTCQQTGASGAGVWGDQALLAYVL